MSNGVRQGCVSSGVFFVIYIDQLLEILRNSGFGCTIYRVYFGAVIYADDIFLLSASRTGLQQMMNLCQSYAASKNLRFGTDENPQKSKTKCIIFSKKKQQKENFKNISLDGNNLPWVDNVKHLGQTLQTDNSMSLDINDKRGSFIGKTNSLIQEFHYAAPSVLLKLLHSYACNIYGSNIWDLFSKESHRLFTSYNVAVRNIMNLPRTTHRYLLEPLSEMPHLYTLLLARYVTFVKSLLKNEAFEVRYMASLSLSDMRTVTGRSIARILDLCHTENIADLSAYTVKKMAKYAVIPVEETWRIGVAKDMLSLHNDNGLTSIEASEILEFVCSS